MILFIYFFVFKSLSVKPECIFLCFLSSFCRFYCYNMSTKSKFKTLVIVDLETTGLVFENPKITELAMVAVNM